MIRFVVLFLSAAIAPSLALAGPIFVYRDAGGAVHFSSKEPPAGVQAKVFTAQQSKFSYHSTTGGYRWRRVVPNIYNELISSAARRHQLSAGLVKAIIAAESAFNPRAVSRRGALGLMQLMPENCKRYGVKDPFSAEENIDGGVRLLADLIRRYDGNLPLTLAAYNAGMGAVEKYGGVPPFAETQDYVRRVLHLRQRYQGAL